MRIDDLTKTPEMKTLYLSRKVLNGKDIMEWAKEQGFTSLLNPDDMHVTIAYSDKPLDWTSLSDTFETITIKKPDTRSINLFDGGAVVLCLENADVARRWQECIDNGATWSYPDYSPHVTLTYGGIGDLIIEDIKPFTGNIKLGPEIFSQVNKGWKSKTKETDLENDAPEDDMADFFWFHPDGEKYIECDNHAEYVSTHARKMKLDAEDIADIVGQDGDDHVSAVEADELCDYALDNGWVMGSKSIIRASNVSSLRAATAYFTKKWPGRNATLNVRDKFDVKATPEEILSFTDEGMLPESVEGSPSLPSKFWLVFDVPRKNYGHDDERNAAMIADIKAGTLHGVKGISETREIITQWLHVARNAALVMDAHSVAAVNKLQRIHYSDVEELSAKQMKILYRLLSKSQDKNGHYGLMQTLMTYAVRAMKDIDYNFNHQMNYYGFESRVAGVYSEAYMAGGARIADFEDLCNYIYEAVKQVANEGGTWRSHLAKEFEGLDKIKLDQAVRQGVTFIGRMYEEEGEWIVDNDPFVVPNDSTLILLHDAETAANFNEWSKDTSITNSMNKYRVEYHQGLLNVLEDGQLEARYNVRLVDSEKFAKVRSIVSDRRSKARRT